MVNIKEQIQELVGKLGFTVSEKTEATPETKDETVEEVIEETKDETVEEVVEETKDEVVDKAHQEAEKQVEIENDRISNLEKTLTELKDLLISSNEENKKIKTELEEIKKKTPKTESVNKVKIKENQKDLSRAEQIGEALGRLKK